MKLTLKLALSTLLCVGLFTTGCSQQQTAGSQQVAAGSQQTTQTVVTEKVVKVVPPAKRGGGGKKVVKQVRRGGGGKRRGGGYRGPVVPPVKMPPIKAKGYYKGPVGLGADSRVTLQPYQR